MPTARAPLRVVLVGLPGSGKTTVGRGVAARLGRPFVDFDEEIERREGQSVAAIFAGRGESYFRDLERRLTEELCAAGGGMVLAPGGGWVTVPGVIQLARPAGAVIYLTARPETLLARMGALRERRPLLAEPDPLAALNGLLEQRRALYEAAAHLVVDTELLDLQRVIDEVVARISLFERNPVVSTG